MSSDLTAVIILSSQLMVENEEDVLVVAAHLSDALSVGSVA